MEMEVIPPLPPPVVKRLSVRKIELLASLGGRRFCRIPLLQEAGTKEVLIEEIKKRCAMREKVIYYSGRPSEELTKLKEEGVVIPPTPPTTPEKSYQKEPKPKTANLLKSSSIPKVRGAPKPKKPRQGRNPSPTLPPEEISLSSSPPVVLLATTRTRVIRPPAAYSNSCDFTSAFSHCYNCVTGISSSPSTPSLGVRVTPSRTIGKEASPRRRNRSSSGGNSEIGQFSSHNKEARGATSFARTSSGLLGPSPVIPTVEEKATNQFWEGDPEEDEDPHPRVPLDALLQEIGLDPQDLAKVDNDKILEGVIKSCESPDLASKAFAFDSRAPSPTGSVEIFDTTDDEDYEKEVSEIEMKLIRSSMGEIDLSKDANSDIDEIIPTVDLTEGDEGAVEEIIETVDLTEGDDNSEADEEMALPTPIINFAELRNDFEELINTYCIE